MNTVSPELDRRFRDAAAATGLLDVAYDLVDSPVGPLLVAVSERGLCRISFDSEGQLEPLSRSYGPRVLRSAKPVDPVRRQLDEYFEGTRHDFELQLDLTVSGFYAQVLGELALVPYGETTTYGALAARTGRPKAARAIGTVMHNNPVPIVLPCHRVIGSTGSLTGYGGGLETKRFLLELERGGATLF
jgi:methylated-DNA-[protein]-cysteine S-methyltransferase